MIAALANFVLAVVTYLVCAVQLTQISCPIVLVLFPMFTDTKK